MYQQDDLTDDCHLLQPFHSITDHRLHYY